MKRLTFILLSAACLSTYAQKLPNVQQASSRAPANVKIDGKATEWGKKLQAYNLATGVYYSMANDDTKLYLVVQASGWVLNNITNGGIRLAIQKTGGKKDAGAPFPSVVSFSKRVTFNGSSNLTEQQKQNLENFDNYSNKMTASTDFWGEYTLAK